MRRSVENRVFFVAFSNVDMCRKSVAGRRKVSGNAAWRSVDSLRSVRIGAGAL